MRKNVKKEDRVAGVREVALDDEAMNKRKIKIKPNSKLKYIFILGSVVDGVISISWLLIASGITIPNVLNGYIGTGIDYRLAMYIGAMFMAGWAVVLAWASIKPTERRALLLITAFFLMLSVVIEVVFFEYILNGFGFVLGATKRIVLGLLFSASYFSSVLTEKKHIITQLDKAYVWPDLK